MSLGTAGFQRVLHPRAQQTDERLLHARHFATAIIGNTQFQRWERKGIISEQTFSCVAHDEMGAQRGRVIWPGPQSSGQASVNS